MTTLTIDLRKLMHSGIGRYLRNIVPGVLARAEADRIQLLGDPTEIAALGALPRNVAVLANSSEPHSLAEQTFAFDRRLPKDGLLWVPHYNVPLLYRGRLAVTVHDLAPIDLAENFGAGKRLIARGLLQHLARRSSAILTPSWFTRGRIMDLLGAPSERIHVTPLAVESTWPALPKAPLPHVEDRPYLLFVGNLKPNKNLTVLLEALRQAGDSCPYRLLIAGRTDGFRTADERGRRLASELGDRVRLLGEVTEEHLISLYRGAAALVMPSLYEGFGLPVLEAMRYGCPVLASNVTSLPEVAGDAALLFPPRDASRLAEAIGTLANPAVTEELRRAGLERERGFSFLPAIETTSEVLNALLHASASR